MKPTVIHVLLATSVLVQEILTILGYAMWVTIVQEVSSQPHQQIITVLWVIIAQEEPTVLYHVSVELTKMNKGCHHAKPVLKESKLCVQDFLKMLKWFGFYERFKIRIFMLGIAQF